MISKRALAIWLALLAMVATGFSPANAAEPQVYGASTKAAGLIVRYHSGVSALAANGSVTGQNSAAVHLSIDSYYDTNAYVIAFDAPMSAKDAQLVANRMAHDSRVDFVSVNTIVSPAALPTKHIVIKAASAVTGLVVKDSWLETDPLTARGSLTWKAPTYLYGAKLVGYQIEYSTDGFASFKAVKTGTTRSYNFVGLASAIKTSFRVKAITKVSSTSKVGTASSVKSLAFTTAPQPPLLVSGSVVTATNPVIKWLPQTTSQQGGLAVTYDVKLSAPGQTDLTCTTIANTCTIQGLAANINYAAELTATNARGTTKGSSQFTPADADYGKQWYLNGAYGINAPKAWAVTLGSADVVVAVLDGGITAHPQLGTRIVPGYDFVSNVADSNDGDGPDPDASDPGDWYYNSKGDLETSDWHGTHVAGLIAAAADSTGIIGVAPNVRVQSVRVMGATGGTRSDLIRGINWAAGLSVPGYPVNPTPAKVINMSLGTETSSLCDNLPLQGRLYSTAQALAAVKAAGVTTITAAGNSGADARYSYPGNCYPTINVGATGLSGDRAWYSNFTEPNAQGVGVDISAPGGDNRDSVGAPAGTGGQLYSLLNTGTMGPADPSYGIMEGTSMAAPLVSGAVALLYSIKPTITFDEVWTVLSKTVSKFKPGGQCATSTAGMCGIGILNIGDAVTYLVAHL
ncbi:MAG: hypothetical protein RLZZ164_669 [Actinomycetota bacterium]